MHGLGNDFVIFDGRRKKLKFSAKQARAIADRRLGVGCDQVIVLECWNNGVVGKKRKIPSLHHAITPSLQMRIYNADGGEVASCGNATRCVAWLIMEETGKKTITVQTKAGTLVCNRVGKDSVRVDMGKPGLGWKDIPLAKACDTLALPISQNPSAVSMGNPHMVFVVNNAGKVPVGVLGPKLERHPLFPKRANVSFAEVITKTKIKLRVWERGAGETLACGTAACATLVALHRKGLVSNRAEVELPGGVLDIEWDKKTGHVFMTGPVALVFQGEVKVGTHDSY